MDRSPPQPPIRVFLNRALTRRPAMTSMKFVTAAFELILGSTPTKEEMATCIEALAELRDSLKDVKEPEKTKRARLQVVQALVNHNDFVTVR